MCRPTGALSYSITSPTASAVGYDLSSLTGLVLAVAQNQNAPNDLVGGVSVGWRQCRRLKRWSAPCGRNRGGNLDIVIQVERKSELRTRKLHRIRTPNTTEPIKWDRSRSKIVQN